MAFLDLTELERVKRRISLTGDPAAVDTQMDTLLGVLIDAVSVAFEKHIGARILVQSYTEVQSARAFQFEFTLKNVAPEMPAPTITSVKTRTHWSHDWDDQTALTADTDYTLSADAYGRILFASAPPEGRDTVRIAYSSGFAATTAALISAFPDIVDAADSQVVYEYQRRKDPGKNTTAVQGSTSTEPEVRLLASVLDRLQPYRRVWI